MKQSVSKKVNFILMGERPGKNKISAGRRLGTHMVGGPSLHCLPDGELDWELFFQEPSPVIKEFLKDARWTDKRRARLMET